MIRLPQFEPGSSGNYQLKSESPAKPASSYGQILKASSIIGGAQGINYLISMVRIKLVAVLLGPSGVGLVGLYVTATGLMGTIAGLGLDTSGVREVAHAFGSGDAERVARTVKTLRRRDEGTPSRRRARRLDRRR